MTVKEAQKGLRSMVWTQKDAMYNIGFVNSEGKEDEAQFDIHGSRTLQETVAELSSLFGDFCKENGFRDDTVHSIYYAGCIQDQETCSMREKISPAKANGSSWYRGWITEELIYGYVSESSRINPED